MVARFFDETRVGRYFRARPRERSVGCGAIIAGLLAGYVTIPPLLLRTLTVSVALVGFSALAGVWLLMRGERRLALATFTASVAGGTCALAATRSGVGHLEQVVAWGLLFGAMLRFATPLILAALGGVLSERSGVINVGLEGMMLTGAFFAVLGADVSGSWLAGLGTGVLAGALLGLIHALFAISLRADQIVAGMAINLLALGVTGFLFVDIYGNNGTPDSIAVVPDISLPVSKIGLLRDAIDGQNLLVWVGLILVLLVWWILFRLPAGLRLRSVGENPLAADTAGISVTTVRYLAVIASGVLAALGGAFLSLGFVHSFNPNMTAGRGFIALAAVIFGKWRPGGALAAALLFGLSSALAQRLPAFSANTATLFQALPYVLTLIAVAGLVGRSRAPAAIGVPYTRG